MPVSSGITRGCLTMFLGQAGAVQFFSLGRAACEPLALIGRASLGLARPLGLRSVRMFILIIKRRVMRRVAKARHRKKSYKKSSEILFHGFVSGSSASFAIKVDKLSRYDDCASSKKANRQGQQLQYNYPAEHQNLSRTEESFTEESQKKLRNTDKLQGRNSHSLPPQDGNAFG